MILQARGNKPRQGATCVEFAFVAIIVFFLIFGILDLCRFLLVRHVIHAAAREGARYALAHVNDPDVTTQCINRVRQTLLGVDQGGGGTTALVEVYAADAAGNSVGEPGTAAFGQYLCIRIQSSYRMLFPDLFRLPGTLSLEARCLVQSEGQ